MMIKLRGIGMNEEDLALFHDLGNCLLDMYDLIGQNGSKRKIICATDDGNKSGNFLLLFQGNKEDCFAVKDFLNNREKK